LAGDVTEAGFAVRAAHRRREAGCRDDVRCARMAARNRGAQAAVASRPDLSRGQDRLDEAASRVARAPGLDDPLAQAALEQLLTHLDGIERQLATLDARLAEIAGSKRWAGQVEILTRFRGIATITALLRPSAASWAYHPVGQSSRPPAADRGRVALPPRTPRARERPAAGRACLASPGQVASPTPPPRRARQAHNCRERRGRSRTRRVPVGGNDRPATARHRPVRRQPRPPAPGGHRLTPITRLWWGRAAWCEPPGGSSLGSMRYRLATLVRGSSRPDTVLRSRPAHLRVTVVVALAPAVRPHHPPP